MAETLELIGITLTSRWTNHGQGVYEDIREKSNYLIYKLNKSLSESFGRIEEARTAGWKWRQPLAFNQFPKYQRRRPIPSLAAAKMHKLAFAVSSEISK